MAITWGEYGSGSGPFDWPDNFKISLDPVLHKLFVTDQTVLSLFKVKNDATAVEHKWFEYVVPAPTITASYTAATNTLTITSPSTANELANIVRKYTRVKSPDGTFVVEFTADPVVGDNTVNVVYGTGADVASSTWRVITSPAADEERIETGKLQPKVARKNFTQIFSRSLEIAKTRLAEVSYPNETGRAEFERQLQDKLNELKREMDIAVIEGIPQLSGGTPTGDMQYHTMAGIRWLLRDPDMDGTFEDTLVVDAGGATLSKDLLNTAIQNIWNAGGLDGSAKPVIVCSAATKRIINGFDEAIRRTDRADNAVGYTVDTFIADIGIEIPVKVDRFVPNDEVYILDSSRLVLNWVKGDSIAMTKLPQTNPRVLEYHISGQATIEVVLPENAHALIRNLG